MFDIGFLELMVVGIMGLLVLGPERLPKAARTIGLLLGKVRRTMNNIQDDLERQVRTEELRQKLKDPYSTFLDEETTKPTSTHSIAPTEDVATTPNTQDTNPTDSEPQNKS